MNAIEIQKTEVIAVPIIFEEPIVVILLKPRMFLISFHFIFTLNSQLDSLLFRKVIKNILS